MFLPQRATEPFLNFPSVRSTVSLPFSSTLAEADQRFEVQVIQVGQLILPTRYHELQENPGLLGSSSHHFTVMTCKEVALSVFFQSYFKNHFSHTTNFTLDEVAKFSGGTCTRRVPPAILGSLH